MQDGRGGNKRGIYYSSNTAIVDPDLNVPAGFDVERLKNAGKAFLFRQKSYLTAMMERIVYNKEKS